MRSSVEIRAEGLYSVELCSTFQLTFEWVDRTDATGVNGPPWVALALVGQGIAAS
jgi:plasmid maintenance system killer protein